MQRRLLSIVFVAGLVTLIGVPAVWLFDRAPAAEGDVGRFVAETSTPSTVEPSVTEDARPGAPDTAAPPTSEAPTAEAPVEPLISDDLLRKGGDRWVFDPEPRPEPVAIRIPAMEVDAPVVSLGVDSSSGQMDVPRNAADVAWYRHGPLPGEEGSAVLAAHVDYNGRPGVFFDLKDLEPGDVVEVELSDGSVRRFEVQAEATFTKEELPLDRIFAREGDPVLTLVTCGGGFNETDRSYDSNVVVFASPIDGEAPAA